jgi:hypothetical protein
MASSLMMVVHTETCSSSTFIVNIYIKFNILLEQSNCALVGQIKIFDNLWNTSVRDYLK